MHCVFQVVVVNSKTLHEFISILKSKFDIDDGDFVLHDEQYGQIDSLDVIR